MNEGTLGAGSNRIDELLPWSLDSIRLRLDQRLAA